MPVNVSSLVVSAGIEGAVGVATALGSASQAISDKHVLPLQTGTSAGQMDTPFTATRTLAPSANESLDLNGGLTDAFGQAANFAKIVAIKIRAAAGNTNQVIIGGAASNGWFPMFGSATDTVKLPPGASITMINDTGWSVIAGTGDLLKVANSGAGTSVSYDITIVGRSA